MRKFFAILLLIFVPIVLTVGVYEVILQNAYTRVENLTGRYGMEIQPVLAKALEKERKSDTGDLTITLEYFKVFDIVPDSAKVFVVLDTNIINDSNRKVVDREGYFQYLKRQGGNWQIDETKPLEFIWSRYSAEMIKPSTWPPYY